ncbi:MAG: translocation/assembly module TamB domain-containing protein [Hormoscilla sp. SP12CHS1]|nr:translocation/assembly module TamB domain-containing protein [Hormoscilla sp. SP12CHS1]
MSNESNSNNQPDPKPQSDEDLASTAPGRPVSPGSGAAGAASRTTQETRRGNRLLYLRRCLPITLGGLLLVGAGAGAWYSWRWLHEELAPTVEEAIDGTISREFRMGQLESIVPQLPPGNFRLRFGSSGLPPTETNASYAATEAVEVNVALRPMLWSRSRSVRAAQSLSVNLDIRLIRPEVYLQEDEEGNWLNLTIQPQPETWLKISTDQVAIQDARIQIVPFPQKAPVSLSSINSQLNIFGNNQNFRFDINGKLDSGGDFNAQGNVQLSQRQANVQVRTQALCLAPLSSLIPDFLAVTVQSGILDSNIFVRYRNDQPSLNGTVSFQDIAATYAPASENQTPVSGAYRSRQLRSGGFPERACRVLRSADGPKNQDKSTRKTPKPLQIAQTQGRLNFQDKLISLEEVSTLYAGKIPVTAQGEINIEKGLDVLAQVGPVTLEHTIETVGVSPPVQMTGEVKIEARIEGPFDGPVVQGNLTTTKPIRIDKVDFEEISAQAQFINNTLVVESVEVKPEVGGVLTAKGEVKLGEKAGIALDFMVDKIPGDAIAQLYGFSPDDITLGEISAEGAIFGPPTDIRGELSANIAGGGLQADARITTGRGLASGILRRGESRGKEWQFGFHINKIKLGEISPKLPPSLQVPLTGEARVWGSLDSLDLENIQGSGEGSVAGGRVDLSGQLHTMPSGRRAKTRKASLVSRDAHPVARLPGSDMGGRSRSADGPKNRTRSVRGRPEKSGEWQAQVQTLDIDPERLSPEVRPGLLGQMTGTVRLAGSLTDAIGPDIEATAEGSLWVADSLVEASGRLKDGEWQALVQAPRVEIDRLSSLGLEIPPLLQGISGSTVLKFAGDVNAKTIADIEGEGEVVLFRDPVLERGTLKANWVWNGDRVLIEQVSAPGLSANGSILPNLENPLLSNLDLNLDLKDLNLAELPVPENVKLTGNVDFAGTIGGEIITPRVNGNLRLRGLGVNDLAFDPDMSGPVIAEVGEGVSIDLKGNEDQIALVLKSNYYPESFTVKVDEAIATGRSLGDRLLIDMDNFQLGMLNIQPDLGPGQLSGKLWGDFDINIKNCLNEFRGHPVPFQKNQGNCLEGTVTIEHPAVGHLQADNLEATFRYGTGLGTLENASLDLGNSEYKLAGKYNILTETGDGNIKIVKGDIQEILETLKWFNFTDIARGLAPPSYAKATDMEIFPVGETEKDVLWQLRRFSEIRTLVQLRAFQQETNPIPELSELDGSMKGEVDLATAPATGMIVDFDVLGTDWSWGEYDFNPIVLKGGFADNVLSLDPIRIESGPILLTFNGQVGVEQQSGQLRLENLPVELIERFVPQKFPVDITGKINVTATLGGGTLENPRGIGEMRLVDGTLNETELEFAKGSFSLDNGLLRFGFQVRAGGAELVKIKGSIPNLLRYQADSCNEGAVSPIFRAVCGPIGQEIQMDAYVEDEGLAVLDILSREQVKWGGGSGFVLVEIRGTFDRPVVDGSLLIENGIFTTEQLPEPLTDVKGLVKFDGDRIFVERWEGNFSGGQLRVAGELPLLSSAQRARSAYLSTVDNPLTIDLENLALDFNEIFSGEVNGNIVVSGTAMSPKIGGNIRIPKGKVFLSQAAEANVSEAEGSRFYVASGQEASAEAALGAELENLQISLGDRVSLRWPGLMNIRATGDLTINGTIEDMRPDGDIFLPRGYVNLYTTQFRLTENYDHKARFRPRQGLEPDLDIRLETAVTEIAGARQANITSASEEGIFLSPPEISDRPVLGGLGTQTVEIEARVEGQASGIQTGNALTLSSSPRRSQSEIIALLSGNLANTLSGSDSTLALANLAGTALLSNIENTITDKLGLTALRLFPVLNFNETTAAKQDPNFPLSLGAEASIQITDNFGASILKILTDDRPAQFSLRVTVSDHLRLRGATNFSGDDRAQIEYEVKF